MQLTSQQEIRRAYEGDTTASCYTAERFTSELMRLLHDRQVAAVQRAFDSDCPAQSLEIAPGPGRITRDLRPSGRLLCLEYNAGMIAVGQNNCRNGAEWIQGDAFEIGFQAQFDLVYSFRFIRHFHRADRERLYHNIHQALLPRKTFVFDAVNERVSKPLRQACPEGYPVYDKLYRSEGELTAELHDAGFQVERIDAVQRWYSMQYRAQVLLGPRSDWLCRQAIRGLERLRRGPALEWIVTCRRA